MTDRLVGGWLLASVCLHATGLAVASALATSAEPPPPVTVPIEVVNVDTPPPPPPPPPRPRPAPPRALTPPKVAETPKPLDTPPNLLDDTPRDRVQVSRAPVPSNLPPSSAPVLGGPAGAGKLFAGGDLLVPPGSGVGGGGGGGASGRGDLSVGREGPVVASTTGLTSLARPLGGYQVKPDYPEAARRARVEGVTKLRFVVLATGKVGPVLVAESAGHDDLDRAAIEAIKQWQFEPARRGVTPVAVWVTLPVRFELTGP